MAIDSNDIWKELRKPFDKKVVGLLPKVSCSGCAQVIRDKKGKACASHTYKQCTACSAWITSAHIHLDYIGHAAVTDRLNTVDPKWTWEPAAVDPMGSPALDKENNLWIRLTIGGVTRLGVGDGKDMKERVGDALRNAAMRFGVALDLWTKDELESTLEDPSLKNAKATDQAKPAEKPIEAPAPAAASEDQGPGLIKPSSMTRLKELVEQKGLTELDAKRLIGKHKPENESEVQTLITALEAK